MNNIRNTGSNQTKQLLTASWSKKTQASYNIYLRKWEIFCKDQGIANPYNATRCEGIEFLSYLFHKEKAQYGYIAAARSALSAVLPKLNGTPFGKNEDVSRLLKGIFIA